MIRKKRLTILKILDDISHVVANFLVLLRHQLRTYLYNVDNRKFCHIIIYISSNLLLVDLNV